MQYILINDFYQVLKAKYKYLIAYFIITYIFLFFELFLQLDYRDIFLSLMGIKIVKNNILFILLYLSSIIMSLFIAYNIFSYDFKNSLDNLFLRISPKEWLVCKSISCLFFTIFFRLILFLTVVIILVLFSKNITIQFILLFLKSILYFSFIQSLFILFVFLFQSKRYISFIFFMFIFVVFLNKIIIMSLNICLVYLLLNVLLMVILMYTFENCFVNLFERSGG